MPWFKVDDNLAFHAKTVAAGNPAMGLWVRAGSWAAQHTDGFVPDHMLASLGTKAQADRLVQVRLWNRGRDGYIFHEWTERQPRKADVKAEQAAARDRMRELRAKKKGIGTKLPASISDATRPGDERNVTTRQSEEVQVSEFRSPEQSQVFGRSSEDVRDSFGNPVPVPVPVPVPTQSRPDPYIPAPPGSAMAQPTAQTLIGEWIDHCAEPPPGRVKGHVAKELGTMLGEGIAYDRVRAGLAEWNAKGLHPSALASVVHAQGNRTSTNPRQAHTDDVFSRAMERAGARDQAVGE